MKTIQSMIFSAETSCDMWLAVAYDEVALKDRDKTKEQALMLASYFEGKFDGLLDARDLMNKTK